MIKPQNMHKIKDLQIQLDNRVVMFLLLLIQLINVHIIKE